MSISGPVTILFTDLVESTALLERLGDEAADRLRRAHLQLLREAVSKEGGQEVKSTGDGLMVAFPSSVAAVTCAAAIQRAVDQHNHKVGGQPLAVRVGLHVGEPIHDESDYYGTAVVVAQRLCAAAGGGQILASELVRGMVGARGGFTFESIGQLELKGISEPVAAHAVVWKPLVSPIPLPSVLGQSGQGSFVGRARDIDELWQAWESAGRSESRFVFVVGEPGVGKTRLLAELAGRSHENGGTVLYGRCDEEVSYPFQPWAEALHHYVAGSPPDELETQALHAGADLARLLPELADRVSSLPEPIRGEADAERVRLFEAVARFLSEASRTRPLALLLDDLHWADASSLLLLKHLSRSTERASLLVVGTYRDVELDRRHPLATTLADLRRENISERIRLRGLTPDEVAELLRSRAGHDLGDEGQRLAQALHDETEGNPFFISEILSNMVETGVLFEEGGRWTSNLTVDQLRIPEGVKEAVGRRLARLSEECANVLTIAAVVGRTFDLNALGSLSDISVERLAETLEEAVRHGILVEVPHQVDRYSFSHALIRETLYEELSTNRRIRLHRRTGEVLEKVHGDELEAHLPELAYHYHESALVAGPNKAIEYSVRAGGQALELLAYEEAVAHYQRALQASELEEQPEMERRCDLLLSLAEATWLGGEIVRSREVALDAAALARELADASRLARAALIRGGLWTEATAVDQTQVSLLTEALAALPQTDSIVRARLTARTAMALFPDLAAEPKTQYSAEALDMARRLGDPATLAYALIGRRHALAGPVDLEERLEVTTEAVRTAEAAQEREMSLRARAFRIVDLFEGGDIDEVDREQEAFEKTAEALRQPLYRYLVNIHRSESAIREGRLAEAEKLTAWLFAYAQRSGRPTPLSASSLQMLFLHFIRGDLPKKFPEIEGTVFPALLQALSEDPLVMRNAQMFFTALAGDAAAAGRIYETVADTVLAMPESNVNYLLLIGGSLTDGCLAAGDQSRSSAIYERLQPFQDRHILFAATALVMYYRPVPTALGLLAARMGRPDEAIDHFEAGLAMAQRVRALPAAVWTRTELARALLGRRGAGDRERALALLERAVHDAGDIGMAAALEGAQALRTQA